MTLRSRFGELLSGSLPAISLSPGQIDRLFAHYELLSKWNQVMNLTRVEDLEEAVTRHYAESLFLGSLLPEGAVTVLDLGSGGGFPGVPLAVQRPEDRYILVESHQRKAVFLREATRSYGNVRVFAGRSEAFCEPVDWVVSRAVRPEDVAKAAVRLGASIGLLMGEGDLPLLKKAGRIVWREPVKLPWGARRVAVLGGPAAR